MAQKLTPKQRLFVQEYLITKNATQAAIRAGYEKAGAHVTGCRTLKNVNVSEAIEAGLKGMEARLEKKIENKIMTKAEWLDEVNALANSDVTELYGKSNGKLILSLQDIKDRGLGRLIRKMKVSKDGQIEFELHSKQHALELLAKAQHWVTNQITIKPVEEAFDETDFQQIFNSPETMEVMHKFAKATSKPIKKEEGN